MCEIVSAALASVFSGIGTAAGAVATAATKAVGGLSLGTALQYGGLALSVGGQLAQANAASATAAENVRALEEEKQAEARLTATEDARTRLQFRREIARQRAELAARGIDLNSPTAVALGESAAREMSFESQAIRGRGYATQTELTGQQRVVQARGTSAALQGRLGAATSFLTKAPDIWPGLLT